MAHHWKYCGDINIENGGFFWKEDDSDDYVLAVQVTPCSDAGGPSNLYWIESGSIYLGDKERQNKTLDCIDVEPKDATRLEYVFAALAYYGIESDCNVVVQVGKHEVDDASTSWGATGEPDYILRANAQLGRFVRREFLRG